MRLVRNKSRCAALSALFLLVGLTAWNHTRAKSEARLKSRADETWVEVLGDEEEELLEDATGAEKAVKTLIGNAATGECILPQPALPRFPRKRRCHYPHPPARALAEE